MSTDYDCWREGEDAVDGAMVLEYMKENNKTVNDLLPLVLETPVGYFAIVESDVLDWAGMSLTGTGTSAVKAVLDSRSDGKGLVVSSTPRVSPWRVLMFGRMAADLALAGHIFFILKIPVKR